MFLSEILKNVVNTAVGAVDLDIKSIETDSRIGGYSSIFVALDGENNRGIDFATQAIANGAKAVVVDKKYNYENKDVTAIAVDDPRNALVHMLKNFFSDNFPEHIMGISGTQGKTSVVEFLRQILTRLGYECASIGTLGLRYGTQTIKDNNLTMLEIVDLYRKLNFLKNKNINFVALEVTSQGLCTRRLDGIELEIAGITNIYSHEHLDYHRNMENYFLSKMKMFREHCRKGATAVLNSKTDYYDRMEAICREEKLNILTFGYGNLNDLDIVGIDNYGETQRVTIKIFGKTYSFDTKLFGDFQILNLVEALAFVYSLKLNISTDEIVNTLQYVESAEGRMNFLAKNKKGGYIYVDYAHTPSAFETVLKIMQKHLKKLGNGKLITLFGSGGDRDSSKRPMMGKIAQEFSDVVIITDDNPRTEDPEKIRNDIVAGCNQNDKNLYNFREGREEAIKFALSILGKDDILILLGKGHETYQVMQDRKVYFSEKEIVLNNI
ncbi:MAG: UDP-N-acetylmuramoyl-L-alanyl-D-glutamate--2,6-diaminopimelate ligase [Rickettsiales bacterium]|jgi:UDP-N-acetylmuramoyl-L-alanyl-D-glutamate--2,6-diaminopimelate ligase|nr:UDP-N-acetylmuramoyl-L-alanyl-D-glutamate--2,6-diaminopimelate ligase [Rickettsiales bacterium]